MRPVYPVPVRAVLVFLAVGAVRARIPRAPSAEVLTRARALGVERDPRRMSARELRLLPGIGHKLALAIAEARDAHRGPATLGWEDVPGIGEVRAREIRAWCAAQAVEPDPLAGPGAPGRASAARYAHGVPTLAHGLAWSVALALAGCGEAAREGRAAPAQDAEPASVSPEPSVRTLALLEGSLHARAAGPEDGAVVLLLHGARFSARTWEELGTLAELAGAGYHAVALDWPGYGSTPAWPGGTDAPSLIARACDELGAARVALVGASLGGGFALEFLERSAERVAAFVGIAPAGSDGFAPEAWSTPTLLVWGERDEVLPLARGEALARRLGARLEVLPGAAHPCYLDQPERFHALLLAFLRAHLPAAAGR